MTGKYDPDKVPRPLTDIVGKSGVPWHLYEMQARSLRELYELTGIADMDQPEAHDKPDSHKP